MEEINYRRLYENAALFGAGITILSTAIGTLLGGKTGVYIGLSVGGVSTLGLLGLARAKIDQIKDRLRRGKDISDLL